MNMHVNGVGVSNDTYWHNWASAVTYLDTCSLIESCHIWNITEQRCWLELASGAPLLLVWGEKQFCIRSLLILLYAWKEKTYSNAVSSFMSDLVLPAFCSGLRNPGRTVYFLPAHCLERDRALPLGSVSLLPKDRWRPAPGHAALEPSGDIWAPPVRLRFQFFNPSTPFSVLPFKYSTCHFKLKT